jgi:hypothetical protein
MAFFFFLIFLSFAQIGLHHVCKYAGIGNTDGWLTMCGFCGFYFVFATLIRSNATEGCLGEIEYAIAGAFSFWALLTQIGYVLYKYINRPKEEITNTNEVNGGDFWV